MFSADTLTRYFPLYYRSLNYNTLLEVKHSVPCSPLLRVSYSKPREQYPSDSEEDKVGGKNIIQFILV